MATELNTKLLDKLTGIVKKSPGNSETFYVEASGIPQGQILRYLVLAELKADPSLKIPANGKAIAKARANGVRWPRIAARTGISESKCKELFEAETGTNARDSYTGRGRNFAGTKATTTGGGSGRRGAAAKPAAKSGVSGRRTGVKVVAGRRGAAAKPAAKPVAGRRGTRSGAKSDPR